MNTLGDLKTKDGHILALDFDGTVTKQGGDCEVDLASWLSNGFLPWWLESRPGFTLDGFRRELAEKNDLFSQYDLFNKLYTGCTDEDMYLCGQEIGTKYAVENFWDPTVLDVVNWAREKAVQIIIVTASCEKLVEGIISRAPFQVEAIIGKTFRKRGGLYGRVNQLPRGEGKIAAIRRNFGRMPDIYLALGDSKQSDGPMLKVAQHGFLRNPGTGLFEPIEK